MNRVWPRLLLGFLAAIYAAVFVVLIIMSASARWPFPDLWPMLLSGSNWRALVSAPSSLLASLGLALSTGAASVVISVLWLESTPERFDRVLIPAAVAAIAVPALLIAGGQYAAFLRAGLTGTWFGLFLVHLTRCKEGRWRRAQALLRIHRYSFIEPRR